MRKKSGYEVMEAFKFGQIVYQVFHHGQYVDFFFEEEGANDFVSDCIREKKEDE